MTRNLTAPELGRCSSRIRFGALQFTPLDIGRASAILKPVLKHLDVDQADVDQVFQALADPTRRQMIEALSRGSASVSELAKPLPMSLPAVYQHLQVLEASGLVRSEKVGRVRTCHLDVKMLGTA